MTLTIELTPEQESRIAAAARREGTSPTEVLKKLMDEHLPPFSENGKSEDPTIALMEAWLKEDATDDPDEIRKAEEELSEFKQAINAERERAGARKIYP